MEYDSDIMKFIAMIFLTYRRRLQKAFSRQNITLQQYRILKCLAGNDCLSPSVIADLLFCDRPTASVVIKNTEKKGWIKKNRNIENAKQFNIKITPAGLKKIGELEKLTLLQNLFPGRMAKSLTRKEVKDLERLLKKFWNGINDDG